jgi:hypothetical protein
VTTEWIAVVAAAASAVVALVSAVVGPLVTYRIATRQIRASTVSANRQRWIDQLRDDVCQVLVHMQLLVMARDPRTSKARLDFGDTVEFISKPLRLRNRIALRLNPREATHDELLRIIDAYQALAVDPTKVFTLKEAATASATLLAKAQEILKSEWERVNRGD